MASRWCASHRVVRFLVGGIAFFSLWSSSAGCASADAVSGMVTARAQSVGPYPIVTAVATREPAVAHFLDAAGNLLHQMPLRDQSRQRLSTVCAMYSVPERHSFVIVFSDMAEMWEVSYNPHAPDIGLGMVHDFQYKEGQFAPGYLHPVRTRLPFIAQAAALGNDGHTVVLQPSPVSGDKSALMTIHLDVRKAIREPATPRLPWIACHSNMLSNR